MNHLSAKYDNKAHHAFNIRNDENVTYNKISKYDILLFVSL